MSKINKMQKKRHNNLKNTEINTTPNPGPHGIHENLDGDAEYRIVDKDSRD